MKMNYWVPQPPDRMTFYVDFIDASTDSLSFIWSMPNATGSYATF